MLLRTGCGVRVTIRLKFITVGLGYRASDRDRLSIRIDGYDE